MRVIVIGAGLGGLALAQALRGAGVDVDVYERDRGVEARFQGYRIGLAEEGLADLKACSPSRWHPLIDAIGGEVSGVGRMVDEQCNALAEMPVQHEGTLFDRHVLRHLLLTGLDEHVHFGKRLDQYDVRDDGVVLVTFADGTQASADLLVGADGMGSAVRRQLAPSVVLHDLDVYGGIGRTPLTDRLRQLVPGWSTIVVGPDVRLVCGKMEFPRRPELAAAALAPEVHLPPTADYLRWVLLVPPSADVDLPTHEPDPQTAIRLILSLIKDWHPDLRAIIEQADQRNSGIAPLRDTAPIAPWTQGPVTLLGDAAHPMPPGGFGANLAFRDARLLSERIATARDTGTDLAESVADYEQQMRVYATEAHAAVAGVVQRMTSG
jgi:2-polyprenyl-6-methoxyphenol hydroxylase-like FAD-dependent oxidoreductase